MCEFINGYLIGPKTFVISLNDNLRRNTNKSSLSAIRRGPGDNWYYANDMLLRYNIIIGQLIITCYCFALTKHFLMH